MTNLDRITAKIFAENADQTDNIGQFGSAKAGNKNLTGNVATIQSLPAYTNGWQDAVLNDNLYPTLQEMNGVMKVMSYQTAYIMQKGIAEWDSGTTYYKNDICKGTDGIIYKSIKNDNNNAISDLTSWSAIAGQGETPKIFEKLSLTISATTTDLSSVLPDDRLTYLIWVYNCWEKSNSDGGGNVTIQTDIFPSTRFNSLDYDSGRNSRSTGLICVPVGVNRWVKVSRASTLIGYMKA